MADSGDHFFKGFVLGSIVGGILGVLFAPKSGKELREELGDESAKLFEQSKSDIENAKKAAQQTFEESKNKIIEKLSQHKGEQNSAKKPDEAASSEKTTEKKKVRTSTRKSKQ